jgi:hypothetical protein
MSVRLCNAFNHIVRAVVGSMLFAALWLLSTHAVAQTKVTKDGDCEYTILVPIEIYGPNATSELADRWKRNIEGQWNGPTEEMVHRLYDQLPDKPQAEPPISIEWNQFFRGKYQQFLESVGEKSGALINCCRITVKVDIKIRPESAESSPGYHQIKVVPNDEVRSFVKWTQGAAGTRTVPSSGTWEDDPTGRPPEAHEVGHLMGLDDRYTDTHDDDGNVNGSTAHDGHEHDLMARNQAWPQSAAFNEILRIHGFSCNCCKEPIVYYDLPDEKLFMTFKVGLDAIAVCDREAMWKMLEHLKKLRDQAVGVGRNLPITVKFDLAQTEYVQLLDAHIENLRRAYWVDCPRDQPPRETGTGLTVTSGIDGGQWCTYGDGIGQPTIAIPTNPNGVPIVRGGPVISGPPGGPSTTPGTTPPTTPGQTTTPGGTPSKPPPTRTSGPPSYGSPGYYYPPPRHRYPGRKPTVVPPTAGPPTSGPPTADPPPTPTTTTKPPVTPPPVTSTPPEAPPITIFVKATQSVLEGQPQGTGVPGFNTALFPPTKPDLPFTTGQSQTAQQDTGFDKDPVKCTTGQGGECKLELDLGTQLEWGVRLRGGTGLDRGWNHYRLDYSVPQTSGGVVETTGMKVIPDPKQGLPNGVTVSDDTFRIGTRSFLRLGFDQPFGLTFDPARHFDKMFGGLTYLTDYCRDKQPGPPLGTTPASFVSVNQALPEATIKLPMSPLDRLRALR